MTYLFVAIGGALGACLRYFLINQTQTADGERFSIRHIISQCCWVIFVSVLSTRG